MLHTDCVPVDCPYCGEAIEIVVDLSVSEQTYIEDCFVCCRPMNLLVTVEDSGAALVWASGEND